MQKLILLLPLFALSCATDQRQLTHQQRAEQATLQALQSVTTAIPGPWQPLATAALGATAALLAAWNARQQRQIKNLQNGTPQPVRPPSAPQGAP
jgi:hypothetical protein